MNDMQVVMNITSHGAKRHLLQRGCAVSLLTFGSLLQVYSTWNKFDQCLRFHFTEVEFCLHYMWMRVQD